MKLWLLIVSISLFLASLCLLWRYVSSKRCCPGYGKIYRDLWLSLALYGIIPVGLTIASFQELWFYPMVGLTFFWGLMTILIPSVGREKIDHDDWIGWTVSFNSFEFRSGGRFQFKGPWLSILQTVHPVGGLITRHWNDSKGGNYIEVKYTLKATGNITPQDFYKLAEKLEADVLYVLRKIVSEGVTEENARAIISGICPGSDVVFWFDPKKTIYLPRSLAISLIH